MHQSSTMQIAFSDEAPIFNGAALTVEFTAVVQERNVRCAITAEALKDHCGAPSILEDDLLNAFVTNKTKILHVCQQALKDNAGGSVILRSGYFRVYAIAHHQS